MPSYDRRRFLSCAALCAGVVPLSTASALAEGNEPKDPEAVLRPLRAEARSRAVYGKKLVERLGNRVLAALEEVTLDSGREFGRNAKVARHDLEGLVELWKGFPPVIAYTVDERTQALLRFSVTRCVFAEELRKQGAADLGFAYYCASDLGFGETYSPEIAFERTKTLMQGHECCNHTYRLRKA